MEKISCELCGSGDFSKDDGGLFVCDYCRTKYTPQQARKMVVEGTVRVDRSGDLDKLIRLSSAAIESSNHGEAFDYASKALEIDPSNSAAWQLKGTAAGWQSKLNDLRLLEMITAFRSAIRFADEGNADSIRKQCADQINRVAVACHALSYDHAVEFSSVEDAWAEHVARAQQIISALQVSYEWDRSSTPLENIIFAASKLIEGVEYREWNGSFESTGVRCLSDSFRVEMQSLITSTAEELREFKPDYAAPTPAPKAAGCFVVTATMGNETAFPVVTLRVFRDQVLASHSLGRRLIGWYGEYGPIVAAGIESSSLLRLLSLALIVAPATAVALVSALLYRKRERL